MAAVTLDNLTPSGAGAPLGMLIEADHRPGGTRSGIFTTTGGNDLGHRLIVGPSGSGKFTAAIAPLLLTADAASIFIFDVANGEAVRHTARHRAKLGPVLVLDPYGLTGWPSGALNPLDLLRVDDPDILSRARELADALTMMPKSGGDADYWNGSAVKLLTVLLLHVASCPGEEGKRTLKRVRELIRAPLSPELLAAMKLNPIAGGLVRDRALKLEQAEIIGADKNTFYIQETLDENTAFLDLPEIQRVTAKTDFAPALLRQKVASLYVVVPENKLKAEGIGRWLRVLYTYVLDQMRVACEAEQRGAPSGVPLHVILDEFAALGRFARVKDDMALVRKFGIQIHIAVQKLSQLAEDSMYGKGWETMVPKFVHVLGSDEAFTSEYVSKRLGTTTARSVSTSENRSMGGGSQGSSEHWIDRPLMAPHEIDRLDPARCLVIVSGHEPLFLRKWHYWQSSYLQGRAA